MNKSHLAVALHWCFVVYPAFFAKSEPKKFCTAVCKNLIFLSCSLGRACLLAATGDGLPQRNALKYLRNN